jgi:hypothetical protein
MTVRLTAGCLQAHDMNFMSGKCFVDTNILVYAHDRSAESNINAFNGCWNSSEHVGFARTVYQSSGQNQPSLARGRSSPTDTRLRDMGSGHQHLGVDSPGTRNRVAL